MAKNVVLAGVLGGLTIFAWACVAFLVLPLGEVGIREMPNEPAFLNAVRNNVVVPGLYFFPGEGLATGAPPAQEKAAAEAWQKKLHNEPVGMLVYRGLGVGGTTSKQIMTQFITNLAQGLLAAFLLARAKLKRYSARVGFMLVLALLASINTNVAYWNWYGFPTTYTLAYVFTLFCGYSLAGLVAAAIVKEYPA
ncbi:MAG TPA: hypothetical protein VEW69_05130 [Alphaproteobacteria bacterium]|nr:hypothetical protein [Alphaproteobacteria bacterium]